MPNDDLARFLRRVLLVRENPRYWIAEYRNRIGKGYAVFLVVGPGFARTPCEHRSHRVSLQNSGMPAPTSERSSVNLRRASPTLVRKPSNPRSPIFQEFAAPFVGRARATWHPPCSNHRHEPPKCLLLMD